MVRHKDVASTAIPALVISVMWMPWTTGIAENIGSEL